MMTGEDHSGGVALRGDRPAAWRQRSLRVVTAYLFCALLAALFLPFQTTLLSAFDPALAGPPAAAAAPSGDAAPATTAVAAADAEAEAKARDELAARRLANALPAFALALLLLGLTRRPLLSLWLATLAVALLYAIDGLKHEHLNVHLLPADAMLLPQIVAAPGLYLRYLDAEGIGLGTAAIVLALTIAFCFEPAQRWLRAELRLLLAAGAIGLGYVIATGHSWAQPWYENEALAFEPWTPDASIERIGLIAGLVKLGREAPWQLPEPDSALVRDVLIRHPPAADAPAAIAAADVPDIVIWQSESLFDPARLNGIAPPQHLPQLVRLRGRTLSGDMRVPAYGGGTVRTEFEAMTGYPLHAFPGINYPYSALAQKPLMALPRLLRRHGYETVAIHPYQAGFWGRDRAFVQLGFDRFVDDRAFDPADRHGWYIGDDALLRGVADRLAEERERPLFLFAISMENHGPWHQRPDIDRARRRRIPVPEALNRPAARELRNYLYHARRADRLLAELIELLDARPRHTLLLFYGDHLPGLETAFAQLRFRDGREPWQQPVPFLLYDNRGGARGEAGGELRSYHLASLVLDAAGVRDDAHFRVVSADRERHGRTGLAAVVPDPLVDYDQALKHLSWHHYRLAGREAVIDAAAAVAPALD